MFKFFQYRLCISLVYTITGGSQLTQPHKTGVMLSSFNEILN